MPYAKFEARSMTPQVLELSEPTPETAGMPVWSRALKVKYRGYILKPGNIVVVKHNYHSYHARIVRFTSDRVGVRQLLGPDKESLVPYSRLEPVGLSHPLREEGWKPPIPEPNSAFKKVRKKKGIF